MRFAAISFWCACAFAQPSFEVASVKRLPLGARHGGTTREVTSTSLTIRNATIGNSIYWAWGYENFRVIGPSWRDYPTDVVFDVVAKTAAHISSLKPAP